MIFIYIKRYNLNNTTLVFKNPSFSEKLFIKQKALQQNAKGLGMSGSPYWKHLELLRGILILTILD